MIIELSRQECNAAVEVVLHRTKMMSNILFQLHRHLFVILWYFDVIIASKRKHLMGSMFSRGEVKLDVVINSRENTKAQVSKVFWI